MSCLCAIIISTVDISAINSYQGRWNLQSRIELSLQDFDFHWNSRPDPTAMFTLAQAEKTTSNSMHRPKCEPTLLL